MIDFLYSIDVAIFSFLNHTIANPLLDQLLPFLTDLNKHTIVVVAVALFLLGLVIKGDKNARAMAGLLVITVIISDQTSSALIKHLVERIRPCSALDGVRLLVNCGSGYSFPSSHAVNNFAGATIISHFYSKQKWYWFSFASVIALSRPYVGVHYPSDIIAGGLIGSVIALGIIQLWNYIDRKFLTEKSYTI